MFEAHVSSLEVREPLLGLVPTATDLQPSGARIYTLKERNKSILFDKVAGWGQADRRGPGE